MIDSEDWQETYYSFAAEKIKINGYMVNESGERLQLFILNEDSVNLAATENDMAISQKSYYENHFSRAVKFVKRAINRNLEDTQDSSPANVLINQLSSGDILNQFDVVEIFLVSATATMEMRGNDPKPKKFDFENEEFSVSYAQGREQLKKKMLIIRRLIDLNFLLDVMISQGNREILTIEFGNVFGAPLSAIKAASEANFESYLCVIPATNLAELYRLHSTRLLEKNVRSFLDYKNDANRGMLATMKKDPSKFIAFNNGLTITATASDTSQQSGITLIHSLTDFQIVNGGQTTASIYFGKKANVDISKVFITAKINVVKEVAEQELNAFIKEISLYSNTQNKVTTVDLDSQNPQLIKLKAMTMSVVTPSGKKWFFDRARGEYSTMLKKSGNRNRLEKEFEDRRFSKEDLGKYYTAWGAQPYMVKKGGIKVFKFFITALCGDGEKRKPVDIDRTFYEELIAKIILFDRLNKIHGIGKRAIGQLRSAVVPYAISILYAHTDGGKSDLYFDLSRIWKSEGLEEDLADFMEELMRLTNELIKKYADSDDVGENSKKKELWDRVCSSTEIQMFMSKKTSIHILGKYTISTEERKKLSKRNKKIVDFKYLSDNVSIFTNGIAFYDRILVAMNDNLSTVDLVKLSAIKSAIAKREDLSQKHINFEQELTRTIGNEHPEVFEYRPVEEDLIWKNSFEFILKVYNNALENNAEVSVEFKKIEEMAKHKGIKYYSVFVQIGEALNKGQLPTMQQLWYASHILELKGSAHIL
ncbi:AIPR family protein [Pedobacter africanus]|uniref:AIPR family protein n=1 Tax=Pedobacter africanus TaxID=151894 RepID=UPI00190E9CF9|nr:AIPR family protein [Pedobacter africanus]